MTTHTLKEGQARELQGVLEKLLASSPKPTEEGSEMDQYQISARLLWKLRGCSPNPGQVWGQLYLNEKDEPLFEILCRMAWGPKKPVEVYTQTEDSPI